MSNLFQIVSITCWKAKCNISDDSLSKILLLRCWSRDRIHVTLRTRLNFRNWNEKSNGKWTLRLVEKVRLVAHINGYDRLEAEKQAWDILLASSSALPPSDPAQLSPTRSNHPESTSVNLQTSLLPPDQAAIVTSLIHPSESTPPSATRPTSTAVSNHRLTPSLPSSRLRTIATSLEPTIDTFADGVHKISQYRLAAERVADHVLGVAASVLEERDKAVKERSGTAGVMMKDVLGALGGVMAARGTGAGLKDGRRDWER